jgi:hypothetical protein
VPPPEDTDESTAALVREVRAGEQMLKDGPAKTGRAAALLHEQGFSWPAISRLTGIPMSTLYRRAQPFIERNPSRSRTSS